MMPLKGSDMHSCPRNPLAKLLRLLRWGCNDRSLVFPAFRLPTPHAFHSSSSHCKQLCLASLFVHRCFSRSAILCACSSHLHVSSAAAAAAYDSSLAAPSARHASQQQCRQVGVDGTAAADAWQLLVECAGRSGAYDEQYEWQQPRTTVA